MRLTRTADIGALVRDYRRVRKLRQTDLAARLQVSPKWLSQLENGKPTIQIGLALRILGDLGIALVAEPPVERTPSMKQTRRRFSINEVVDTAPRGVALAAPSRKSKRGDPFASAKKKPRRRRTKR